MEINNDNTFGVADPVNPAEDNSEVTTEESTVNDNNNETEPGQDNSVEEHQEVETENNEQEHESELILGKFKTQDDLVNAYKNLEAYATKLSQKKVAPQQEQPQNTDLEKEQDERIIAWYQQEVQTNPVSANATLARYIAQKEINNYKAQFENQLNPIIEERQQAELIKSTASKYNDFFDYNDAMTEEINLIGQTEPELLNSPILYEVAYNRAKIKDLQSKYQTAFENGKKTALDNNKAKKKVNNEMNKSNNNEDTSLEGINIIPESDGVFF